MSKIPQGEWNAIAVRYQNGESISEIARGYGCTPPAIHYILKRNRQQAPEIGPQPAAVPLAEAAVGLVRTHIPEPVSTPAQRSLLVRARAPEPQAATAIHSDQFTNGPPRPALARENAAEPTGNLPLGAGSGRGSMTMAAMPGSAGARDPGPALSHQSAKPAPLPGLDNELHLRAEAAIALFRSSFDAALAEGSPSVRERLRQAASDLMRVAARTTIVLDRLNAGAERSATRAQNYPRSAHAGEDFAAYRRRAAS
jgi:transposase-like protein